MGEFILRWEGIPWEAERVGGEGTKRAEIRYVSNMDRRWRFDELMGDWKKGGFGSSGRRARSNKKGLIFLYFFASFLVGYVVHGVLMFEESFLCVFLWSCIQWHEVKCAPHKTLIPRNLIIGALCIVSCKQLPWNNSLRFLYELSNFL